MFSAFILRFSSLTMKAFQAVPFFREASFFQGPLDLGENISSFHQFLYGFVYMCKCICVYV